MTKLSNKDTFIILVLVGAFFFLFFMPSLDKINKEEQIDNFTSLLTSNNDNKIDKNMCSIHCCKHVQWPVLFNTNDPNVKPDLFKNYIGSNLSCNNGPTGGGCVCVTKENYEYLSNRGN
jgi:hypothetical protein